MSAEFLDRLRAFVRRRVRSAHDADDIVQDVLTKFLQHDQSINSNSVHAWMFAVARRAIIDRSRANSRQSRSEPGDDLPLESPDGPSASAELARCMEPMLEALASDDRSLLKRIDIEGGSQADLARELGLSLSGLKSRVQRARRRLMGLLEDCCAVERDRAGQPADYKRRPDRPCPCDECE